MTMATVSGVRIAGLASAIPKTSSTVEDMANLFGEEVAQKISATTGVKTRYVAGQDVCTSDLCFAATERLLDELGWERDSISLLIFVSQTSDYILPATATSIHGRLGLSKVCSAFDINLGCS